MMRVKGDVSLGDPAFSQFLLQNKIKATVQQQVQALVDFDKKIMPVVRTQREEEQRKSAAIWTIWQRGVDDMMLSSVPKQKESALLQAQPAVWLLEVDRQTRATVRCSPDWATSYFDASETRRPGITTFFGDIATCFDISSTVMRPRAGE